METAASIQQVRSFHSSSALENDDDVIVEKSSRDSEYQSFSDGAYFLSLPFSQVRSEVYRAQIITAIERVLPCSISCSRSHE